MFWRRQYLIGRGGHKLLTAHKLPLAVPVRQQAV